MKRIFISLIRAIQINIIKLRGKKNRLQSSQSIRLREYPFNIYSFLTTLILCLTSSYSYSETIDSDTIFISQSEMSESISTSNYAGHSFFMAVKSNMLKDVMLVPDLSVEFYLGNNFTIGADWMYAWWSKSASHRYWRIYGGEISARYWFGKAAHAKPLTGHHAGVYAGAFTFDFQLGKYGYIGGKPGHNLWNRCIFNFGIEYGYSLPVARRWNIDFTIGAGYMTGIVEKLRTLNNEDYWLKTSRRTWIGPSKAEISLVWLIGPDNYNKKGGER